MERPADGAILHFQDGPGRSPTATGPRRESNGLNPDLTRVSDDYNIDELFRSAFKPEV